MKIWFSKYEALGNDFLIIDLRVPQGGENFSPSDFAKKYCSRNFGIGSDGVLVLLPSATADFKMRVFNADGSEAEMSGNGIRCLAQYIFDMELKKSDTVVIETLAGRKTIQKTENGLRVDMGQPKIVSEIEFDGLRGTRVDTGNPHIVFFGNYSRQQFLEIGSKASKSFNANVEFVKVISPVDVESFVWERGVGETLACGTGATAITKAGVEKGILAKEQRIKVKFPGGDLYTIYADNSVFIEGKANFVFSGYVNL